MSRPTSAPRVRLRVPTDDADDNGMSQDDLLVARYLNELRLAPTQGGQHLGFSHPSSGSHGSRPSSSHVLPTPTLVREALKLGRTRPHSAYNASSTSSSPRKARPQSAPTYKRPLSATYGSSRPTSARYGIRKVRSLYKKQMQTIVVTAFKNGGRETFCQVAAPTIKLLLEMCTEKLSLGNAARRVFLEDGTEVFTPPEIPRGADVFISMGEMFKDPLRGTKKNSKIQKNMAWTVNGLVWSQNAKRRTTKPQLTKRFRKLIDTSRRRVLVFKNGRGSNAAEIVANPDRFEDFLSTCTVKLELQTYARILFDWEGNEVTDLKTAPVLDKCLQTWATPVLGPLWVSKGEGFSPKGVKEFLTGLITYTEVKVKEAKHYKQQLVYAKDEETKHKVEIVAIMSMSEGEIDETLEMVDADIDEFTTAMKGLKKQMGKIRDKVAEQQNEGHRFVMQHIEHFDTDHRMVGKKGLRLKVFENGSYEDGQTFYFNLSSAERGASDSKLIMNRLLDECSMCHTLALPKNNTCLNTIAQKLYDKMGKQIKAVHELEYDQEVWLSFGEPFKNPFVWTLSASFDKVRAFNFEGRQRAIREQLMAEDLMENNKSSQWEASVGIPDTFDVHTVGDNMDDMERDHMMALMQTSEIFANAHYVKLKSRSDLLLFPDITVDVKKPRGHKDLWPKDAQIWVISKAGYIYLKGMSQLVLGVTGDRVTSTLGHPTLGQGDADISGFLVSLQKKQVSDAAQQWVFTADGHICNQTHPELYLTYVGSRFGDEENAVKNREDGFPASMTIYVAVCEKLPAKDAKAQRWAIKQERMDNLGQWKHTQVENPEWNKRALSWPVNKDGEFNEKMIWPVEGYLVPYAPPMKAAKKPGKDVAAPLRLSVLKNGSKDASGAVHVVAPDLVNMKNDLGHKPKNTKTNSGGGSRKVHGICKRDDASVDDECSEVLRLEFTLFLERCTMLLNLPFAARRLFDAHGKEHFTLAGLVRDERVYVSCGEAWSDPTLTKAEQQRRFLLSKLSSDVRQIQQYVSLRDPQNLVLEVEGSLTAGAKLIVNQNATVAEQPQQSYDDTEQLYPDPAQNATAESMRTAQHVADTSHMTSHELSHMESERRLNNKKWPWERQREEAMGSDEDENAQNFTNKDLYKKFRPAPTRNRAQAVELQQFVYEDGYIQCQHKHELVLGVRESDQESRVINVVLVKKRPDDIYQRWIIKDTGIIQSKHNPSMVLTVSMPSALTCDTVDSCMTYEGSTVTLQARKTAQFGRANQRWSYEGNQGFIQAFHTDVMDKELTACNRANVCTYAVLGGVEIDQPGFTIEIPQPKGQRSKTIVVCAACARAMRGRHKIQRITDNRDFACAMGTAKEQGIVPVGSFQCLNGKVDLSTHEALPTLEEWYSQLTTLRSELSVRAIAKQISAARVPYTVKVIAYKNGEGRIKPGHLLIGSSVKGILDQCATKLSLSQAARRLYTSDGQLILDLDDLVTWVQQQSVMEAREQLRQEAEAKRGAKGKRKDSNLMSRVHFEDETGSEDEDSGELPPQQQQQQQQQPGQEQPRGDEASQESDDVDDYVLGYRSLSSQGNMDSWYNFMLLMNPMEEVKEDGVIVQWDFFAKRAGTIALQLFRPDLNDMTAFTLTDQITYVVSEPDEFSLDLLTSERTIPVKCGDLLGMYCPGESVVPFDIDPRTDESPFWLMMRNPPVIGQKYRMDTWMQEGSRKYPFNVVIRPLHRFNKSQQNALNVAEEHQQQQPGEGQGEDQQQKRKKSKKSTMRDVPLPHIEPPSVESVLRYPIEVWVSSGENFIPPEKVERNHEKSLINREEVAAVSYELDKEKHVLRQMQGRRYEEQSPGKYRATCNPGNPVLIEQHWQEPTINERQKHDTVHQLQSHLSEVKASQGKKKRPQSAVSSRLYSQPSMKRVLVHASNKPVSSAVYVWGDTLDQLLDNATVRLNMSKPAKYVHTQNGEIVTDISEIERDQVLYVSHTRSAPRFNDSQQAIEVKANWGRTRRQYGPQATDIMVTSSQNNTINVDPFGPSAIMGKQPSY